MKFKVSRQLDIADCGAACLQMIAKHHGRNYSMVFLKERIFVSKYGVSLLNIARGAESLGFRTLNVKLTLGALKKEKPFPCIIHINKDHFVVLYKMKTNLFTKKTQYYIADPAHGLAILSENEFTDWWLNKDEKLGVAMLLSPKENTCNEDGQNSSSSVVQFVHYFKPFSKYFIYLLIGLMGTSLIAFILPFLTQLMVDRGIYDKDLGLIRIILLAQISLLLGQLVINYIRSWLLLHINVRVSINIISDFLSKLMRIPIKFFDSKSQGDIMQRIQDHKIVENFLTNELLNTIFSIINIITFSIVLWVYGSIYFLLFLVGSVISLLWIWKFNEKRRQINYIRFQRNRDSQNSIFEILNGMEDIKLNNNDIQKKWTWKKIQIKLFYLNLSNLRLEQAQSFGSFLINQLKNVVILYFTAQAVVEGNLSIGMMVSVSYIIGLLNNPLEQLSNLVQSLQDTKLSMDRLAEFQYIEDESNVKNITFNNDQIEDKNIILGIIV